MSLSTLPTNRRRRRSNQPLKALTFQLEHIFESEDLHNFTLGDKKGLVLAQAGNRHESEVLAAYAPLLAASVDERSRCQVLARINAHLPTLELNSVHVRPFSIDDQSLFLTLAGRPGVYRDVSLYRAITGVRRILARHATAA